MRIRNLFDPWSGLGKFGSGIKIPDPQHCYFEAFVGFHFSSSLLINRTPVQDWNLGTHLAEGRRANNTTTQKNTYQTICKKIWNNLWSRSKCDLSPGLKNEMRPYAAFIYNLQVKSKSSVADPGCLSRIPDPTFFHPGSELSPSRILIKEFKYFNPQKSKKKWFLSSKKYDPGCSSRIPDPDADFLPSRIPDPGVKKVPNPGSRIRIRNTV